MASRVLSVYNRGLISRGSIPHFVPEGTQYEVITGSYAYGVSTDTSDEDIYGFCMPSPEIMYPHLQGCVVGFDQPKTFDQWQQHHILDKEARKEYDFSIYGIAKYFRLCLDNNPNMIDTLFVRDNCVLHCTEVGRMVRSAREAFLHKGCLQKFKGYAHSQLNKLENKNPIGKRKALVEKFGYDVKFAYHLLRLMDECTQLARDGVMDLQGNRKELQSVRRGDFTKEELIATFYRRKEVLEKLVESGKCVLPDKPDTQRVKNLLTDCCEEYYGSLTELGVSVAGDGGKADRVLADLKELLLKHQG